MDALASMIAGARNLPRHDADALNAELATATRSYTLNENAAWSRHRWTLRCYGQGRCTLGEGVPHFLNGRDAAIWAGECWVSTGIAPADQGARS